MEASTAVDNLPPPSFEDLFPAKLHYILGQAEEDGLANVISWEPHGRAFAIKDRAAFVTQFLPNWFRQKKWPSFQRQLNHYGFKRIKDGPDRNAYYHPCFIRADRSLCRCIQRLKSKGTRRYTARGPDAPPTVGKDIVRVPLLSAPGIPNVSQPPSPILLSRQSTTMVFSPVMPGHSARDFYADLPSSGGGHSAHWTPTEPKHAPSLVELGLLGMAPPAWRLRHDALTILSALPTANRAGLQVDLRRLAMDQHQRV